MKLRRGFTLVELLIVVTIIGLLVAMLMPSLGKAREMAKRVVCGTNLGIIGRALAMYATDNSGAFPTITYANPSADWRNVAVGTNRTLSPSSTTVTVSPRVSANLYLLLHIDKTSGGTAAQPLGSNFITAKAFVCPAAQGDYQDKTGVVGNWDFDCGSNLSYGYQTPYGSKGAMFRLRNTADPGLVLCADRNPGTTRTPVPRPPSGADTRVQTNGVLLPGALDDSIVVNISNPSLTPAQKQALIQTENSPNHESGIGQNVLTADCSVRWQEGNNCGVSGDNIYTGAASNELGNALGSYGKAAWPGPNSKLDSFIYP